MAKLGRKIAVIIIMKNKNTISQKKGNKDKEMGIIRCKSCIDGKLRCEKYITELKCYMPAHSEIDIKNTK
jgi:hypothetical protein